MRGDQSCLQSPIPGSMYAFLMGVAGQDESASTGEQILVNSARESTAHKIVEIYMSTVPTFGKPAYLVVYRQSWTSPKQTTVFRALRALAQTWKPIINTGSRRPGA